MKIDQTLIVNTAGASNADPNLHSSGEHNGSSNTNNGNTTNPDFYPPVTGDPTGNSGRALVDGNSECTCTNLNDDTPQSEKARLNRFTNPVLEFDNAGLREYFNPEKGHLYVICTYAREGDALKTDLRRINQGIKNLDLFKISPELKTRIQTEGGGNIEPLQQFDPGRLTEIEAMNLPEIEPLINLLQIMERMILEERPTTNRPETTVPKPTPKLLEDPTQLTEPTTTIRKIGFGIATTNTKPTECKRTSIIDREIKTFEDYTAIVYGLNIALNKIEKAGKELIDSIEYHVKYNSKFVKLINTVNGSGEVLKTTLAVPEKPCFETAAIVTPLEGELNELAKAILFYAQLTTKLGGRTELRPRDANERLFFKTYERVNYKFSDGICNLLGDRDKAAAADIKDLITLQQREQKIMPYPTHLKLSLARLMHYEGLFKRELSYLCKGLDVEIVRNELSKINDGQFEDLKRILLDFMPRFKRYFCEKITPGSDVDPTKYLKTCIEKLFIRMLEDLDLDTIHTIRDHRIKENLLIEREKISALYNAIEDDYSAYKPNEKFGFRRFGLQGFLIEEMLKPA